MRWQNLNPAGDRPSPSRPEFGIPGGLWRRGSIARILALAGGTLAAALLPGVPNRPLSVLFLTVAGVLTLLIDLFVAARHRYLVWSAQISVTVVIATAFVPELWPAALMMIVGIGAWSAVTPDRRKSWGVFVPALGAMTALGIVHEPDRWAPSVAVAFVIFALSAHIVSGLMARIHENEEVLKRSLLSSSSFVHVSDIATGQVLSITGPIERITGWTEEQWTSMDIRALLHPDDVDEFWLPFDHDSWGHTVEREGRFRTPDGDWVFLRDVSGVVKGEDGRLYLRGFAVDITEVAEANEAIRIQAELDGLTDLPNRVRYVAELEKRLRRGDEVSVMIMDLDRFKTINDTLGHSFGDHVLVEVGNRLAQVAGDDDLVARLGGDEFAVVSSRATTGLEARKLALRIARAAHRPMRIRGMSISTTLSIGVALSTPDKHDMPTLIRHADMAMYEAKRRGRTVQVFGTQIQQTPLEEITLGASLRQALTDKQFVLHFQPMVDLASGEIVAFEGLARWKHPTLGLLAPNRFIHLITASDEGQEFADTIIEIGVRFAGECRRRGHNVPISVNMSARSLFDEALPDRVAATLHDFGLPPHYLKLEITEADIMDEAGSSSRVLERLAQLGVVISIDDFGTGYSSFSRLVDLPVSEIKIDRRFVSGAAEDTRSLVIIKSIVTLAEGLGLDIVAEGVETSEEVALLLRAGCDRAQGFLFARPMPADQALAALETARVDADGGTESPDRLASVTALGDRTPQRGR